MKKIVLLNIALMLAGFLSAPAQNNISIHKKPERQNASFEYPDFGHPKLPAIKKTNSGQDLWVPDTINIFEFDASRPFEISSRDIFKYNSQGLLAEVITQYPIDNSWVNGYLYTYAYDSNNNLQTLLIQRWINNSWENYSLRTYVYDSNNNVLNDGLYTYTYDSNNNVLTKESGTSLYTYTYDSNNNLLTSLWQTRVNNSWRDLWLYTYTYDSNNNVSTFLHQLYRNNNSWAISRLYTYTYDSNNNLLNVSGQKEVNNLWKDFLLSTYTYDSNNNLLNILVQEGANNSWTSIEQHQWIYDENDNCISTEVWVFTVMYGDWYPPQDPNRSIYLYYNNMQSIIEWKGCYKMTASYKKVSDITTGAEPVAAPELNAVSVYPNPTTGELRIRNCESGIKDIRIFDLMGNKFPLRVERASGEVDISHLPPGMYFMQITTEKGVVTKKIVKI